MISIEQWVRNPEINRGRRPFCFEVRVGNTLTSNRVEIPCLVGDLWAYLPPPPES